MTAVPVTTAMAIPNTTLPPLVHSILYSQMVTIPGTVPLQLLPGVPTAITTTQKMSITKATSSLHPRRLLPTTTLVNLTGKTTVPTYRAATKTLTVQAVIHLMEHTLPLPSTIHTVSMKV